VFPATFTGVGPHIAVCAPGVAVLSTVPGGGYAALDGTGAAAALVTGMAAVTLANHPLFQGPLKVRSEHRVSTLFNLIRVCAMPQFADPLRGGAGVPSLLRVPGLHSVAALRSGAPMAGNAFTGAYGAPGFGEAGLAGVAPSVSAWPRLGPAWAAAPQDWGLLMQMRASGWI
jgi:subtilisin family serine protease